jgi:hypothetical protein
MSEVQVKSYQEYIEEMAKAHGVKPLRAGQSVTYVPSNMKVDPDTKRTHFPRSTQISNDITIISPSNNEMARLVYVKSEKPVKSNGTIIFEEDKPLIFIEGAALTIGPKDKWLYYHLEMSDENESKKGRDTNVRARFRRLDAEKTAEDKLDHEHLLRYVSQAIHDMDLDDLRVTASKYKINIDRNVSEIKWDLTVKAKEDPQSFLRNSSDLKGKIKIQIRDAKSIELIKFDEETRVWSLRVSLTDYRDILQVKAGVNSEETFIEYLISKEGEKTLKDIRKGLKGN